MLKPFNELVEVDISEYLVKKPNFKYDKIKRKLVECGSFTYLNWATALILLRKHGAEEVSLKALKTATGHSVFYNKELGGLGCPEVQVEIEIDGKIEEFTYPLIRGSRVLTTIDQLDVEVAKQRCITKGIAIMTGLGLSVWSKTELAIEDIRDADENNPETFREIQREQAQQAYLRVAKKLGGADDLNKLLGKTKKEMSTLFKSTVIQDLKDLENAIQRAEVGMKG